MKTLLASLAALGALAVAAPASAQDFRPGGYGHGYGFAGPQYANSYVAQSARQLERLRLRVREGMQAGQLNRFEGRRFFGQVRALEDLRLQYIRTRGFSPWEARDLEQRINSLRHELRREFYDGRSYSRFDAGDRDYGWDRRYDGRESYGEDADEGPHAGRGPRGDGERGPRGDDGDYRGPSRR